MFLVGKQEALFSIAGSYIVVKDKGAVYSIETIAEGENNPFLSIAKEPGDIVEYAVSHVTVKRRGGFFSIALHSLYDMVFTGNIPIELLQIKNIGYESSTAFLAGERVCINNCRTKNTLWFIPASGKCDLDAPWRPGAISNEWIRIRLLPAEDTVFDVYMQTVLTPSCTGTARLPAFAQCRDQAARDFTRFAKTMQCGRDYEYAAAFVLWSNIVAPSGNYTEDTIVSSKYGMARVWSWDNCFAALGTAKYFPEMAWYMFMLPYRYQAENGYVPDCISPFGMFVNCTKPPIKGWFYAELAKRNPFFSQPQIMEEACAAMQKEIGWWLNARNNAPCYWHGNDSGADNATCFDEKSEMRLPELHGLLAKQASVVAELSEKLGKTRQAEIYRDIAHSLIRQLCKEFWDGSRLVGRRADTGAAVYSQSLLMLRAALAGKALPAEIREYIARTIETRHLGNYGIASEALDSEKFDPDGYWRGAVWPADQIIYSLALEEDGYQALALKIKKRFLEAVRRNGSYENYDVHTGKGIRCPNYIWGAAAGFILADE